VNHAKILRRARSQKFREFQARRAADLIAAGMNPKSAREFAFKETLGRARVSFMFPIAQALAAEIEIIEDAGEGPPTFRLVYAPAV
jgi:hypothetical protein